MKNDTIKLCESINENLKEEEVVNNIPYSTAEEFEAAVKEQGGLYGFVSEKYYTMPMELLKEIALNALYNLNNDEVVIKDIKERLYNEGE